MKVYKITEDDLNKIKKYIKNIEIINNKIMRCLEVKREFVDDITKGGLNNEKK